MTEEVILKVGLTPRHPCSYLGHEQEQLLVLRFELGYFGLLVCEQPFLCECF